MNVYTFTFSSQCSYWSKTSIKSSPVINRSIAIDTLDVRVMENMAPSHKYFYLLMLDRFTERSRLQIG